MMTSIGTAPVSFRKFYGYFERYWNYCRQREICCSSLQVFIMTHVLYEELVKRWKKMKWNIEELKWICSGLDNNESVLDPYQSINDEYVYVNHLKNCFYLYR